MQIKLLNVLSPYQPYGFLWTASSRSAPTHVTVEAPLELRIPEVCCVGLSVQAMLPLKNPTDRWLHVHLKVLTLEVDRSPHDPEKVIPFVMKEKVIIEPKTTEVVKVSDVTWIMNCAYRCYCCGGC